MDKFAPLKRLISFDYAQMRAVKINDDYAQATDEAIKDFVNTLNEFFSAFESGDKPTTSELHTYVNIMQDILKSINQAEYNHSLRRYQDLTPEQAKSLANGSELKSIKDIPSRMQYWAASDGFNSPLRNCDNHKRAVGFLQRFQRYIDEINQTPPVGPQIVAQRNLFFTQGNQNIPQQTNVTPVRPPLQ